MADEGALCRRQISCDGHAKDIVERGWGQR